VRLLLILAFLLAASGAHAARPFVTDDARIVDPGGWQVETFVKRQRLTTEREFWMLPAHNPGGRMEFTLGHYRVDNPALGDSSITLAQVKTLLKPLETNGHGFALTAGIARQNPYLNGIGSVSFVDDRFVLHANLGAVRDRPAYRSRGTWGLGSEVVFTPRLIGIAETYGQSGEKPTFHAGLRFWAIPDRWQVDATVGRQDASPSRRFTSIGMRFLF
jgi:hypothetical protein